MLTLIFTLLVQVKFCLLADFIDGDTDWVTFFFFLANDKGGSWIHVNTESWIMSENGFGWIGESKGVIKEWLKEKRKWM